MSFKRTIYIISLLYFSLQINAQITDFEFNDSTAYLCDSVTIGFTDITTGVITSRKWLLNGDSVSNIINPAIKVGPPRDTITLIVNDNILLPKTLVVEVHQSPQARLHITKLDYTGRFSRFFTDTSILDPISSTNYTFNIDFGDGNSAKMDNTDNGFYHKYQNAGTYFINYVVTDTFIFEENIYFCADTAVETVIISDTTQLFAPNVFTPNNDGVNDVLIIEGNGNTKLNFEVFNRQGVLIYKNTSPIIMWDGKTLSGSEAPNGVYYYIISSEGQIYQNEPIKSVLYIFRDDK